MNPPTSEKTPSLQPGINGFPKLTLSHLDGASAEIYLHGAHLTAWRPAGGSERLYLSPTAEFAPGKAIRGGVPLVFPQFSGMGDLPKHGFLRNLPWELAACQDDRAVFETRQSPETLALWPYAFHARFEVQIAGPSLSMTLRIRNLASQAFHFTTALHTYLSVSDLRQASVAGLTGLRYADHAAGRTGVMSMDDQPEVRFSTEVDRVYFNPPGPLRLSDDRQATLIEADGFPDAVVWNPGADKCARLDDLPSDGYLRYVCVEAAGGGVCRTGGPGSHHEEGEEQGGSATGPGQERAAHQRTSALCHGQRETA